MDSVSTKEQQLRSNEAVGLVERLRQQTDELNDRRKAYKASASGSSSAFETTDEDKATRKEILDAFTKAIGLTQEKIMTNLGLNRSTWTKWRSLDSSPRTEQLDSLEELALGQNITLKSSINDKAKDKAYLERFSNPIPAYILEGGTPNRARIKLFFWMFPWKNAVLRFDSPWTDDETLLEMALLALRPDRCGIVYMHENPSTEVIPSIAKGLVALLGAQDARRAIRRFAFVKLSKSIMVDHQQFSIWNFKIDSPATCGYIFYGKKGGPSGINTTNDDNKTETILRDPLIYDSFGSNRDVYQAVDVYLSYVIKVSLELIDKNTPDPFWDDKATIESPVPVILSPLQALLLMPSFNQEQIVEKLVPYQLMYPLNPEEKTREEKYEIH